MVVTLAYSLWRLFRIIAVLLALTAVFVAAWWVSSLFWPESTVHILLGLFPILLMASVVLIGSDDKAVQAWHAKQLMDTRELYSSLYDLSPVPYLTLDNKGLITTCNMAAARLLDTSLDELKGKELISRLFNEEDETKMSVVLGKIASKSSVYDEEVQIKTFADKSKWVLFSLFINQTFDQQLVALVDMTHQKQVDKAKSEFVSLATHQLRTPVAAIRWNVELLERTLRDSANEKQQNYLFKINRNVARMLALINDFLSVSKLETGSFSTFKETISLPEYFATIVDEYSEPIVQKNIALQTNFNPNPYSITTDSRLLHIIVSNLLSNAVKYVRPNDSISFTYQGYGSEVEIVIADSGIGIPAEELPQLFSKFFRASNAKEHKAEGTGLGLYIVKESVTKLGGTIEVTSVKSEGTKFVVRLPVV